jgi:hypothetical protein
MGFVKLAWSEEELNLLAQILLLVGIGAGFYFARKGNIPAHQHRRAGTVLFKAYYRG